jgi:hypothetical protein
MWDTYSSPIESVPMMRLRFTATMPLLFLRRRLYVTDLIIVKCSLAALIGKLLKVPTSTMVLRSYLQC